MMATRVDPRDVAGEVDRPTYRVYFWTEDGSQSDEWRLTEADDLLEVLAWADQSLGAGRSYQLFVEAALGRDGQGLQLLRLFGVDPTSPH